MNVLHVVSDTDRRGAQVFGSELAERLSEHGLAGRAVALAPGTVGGLDLPTLGPTALGPATLRSLRRAMADVDVTVAHGSSTLLACALAGGGRRRFVYRQISDPEFWASTPARRGRVRLAYRRAQHVVTLSAATGEILASRFGVDRVRLTVIPNGVDDDRFRVATSTDRAEARAALGLAVDAFVVGYVGALAPEKGIDELVAALGPDDRLLVAGDGPSRASLTADPRAVVLGSIADPFPVYAAADVVALPSWTEQQPAAVLEAGCVGRPVVATTVGDLAELVLDGESGMLVPPRDVEALAGALRRLAADPAAGEAMGAVAAEHVRSHHGMAGVVDRWAAALRGVASQT